MLVNEAGLTLDQAAILLEFDGDDETVAELTETATTDPGYFAVAVERARQDRAARQAKEKVEQEEASKGHRILDERPSDWNAAPYRVRMLRTAEGETVEAETIQGKPGVAVYVATYYAGEARAEYFVDDPAALGFTVREESYGGGSAAQSGPMTDEQKAERKALIANNKTFHFVNCQALLARSGSLSIGSPAGQLAREQSCVSRGTTPAHRCAAAT